MPVGTDVARDLADLLVRNVEAVVPPESEEEVIARDARDRLRLEAEQLADAVVFVNDEVAGAEICEALECTPDAGVGPGWPLAENLRVRKQHEGELTQDETTARGRNGEEKRWVLRKVVAGLEQLRL